MAGVENELVSLGVSDLVPLAIVNLDTKAGPQIWVNGVSVTRATDCDGSSCRVVAELVNNDVQVAGVKRGRPDRELI